MGNFKNTCIHKGWIWIGGDNEGRNSTHSKGQISNRVNTERPFQLLELKLRSLRIAHPSNNGLYLLSICFAHGTLLLLHACTGARCSCQGPSLMFPAFALCLIIILFIPLHYSSKETCHNFSH